MSDFLLARPDSVVRASGVRAGHQRPADAAAALRAGAADLIVGALPFDPSRPAALFEPAEFVHTAGPWRPAALPALPPVEITAELPDPAEHIARVAKLVELIEQGPLTKVVAARTVELAAAAPIDPEVLAAHLTARYPTANVFAAPTGAGGVVIGASPELLVARRGERIVLRPLAGTAPRRADPDADRAEAAALVASAKNQAEHRHVIDWIRDRLGPLCTELSIPDRPELLSTPQVWHLHTPIDGTLRDRSITALELAVRLHPTPAVGGTPPDLALATIAGLEGDRGCYGGAVGWCDAAGDGEWVVAIRCAELAADGRTLRATAGGGIVAGSDPRAELDETTVKLRTLLGVLGVQ